MVKFEGNLDADFQAVSSKLVIMIKKAERKVAENWAKWMKIQDQRIPLCCTYFGRIADFLGLFQM